MRQRLSTAAHRSTLKVTTGTVRHARGPKNNCTEVGGRWMRRRFAVSMALLSIALAATCAKKPDDAALVTSIQSKMSSDPQLKDVDLQVTSNKGVVTLSGTVPSDAARLDAYKIATQTPGVTKVTDEMTVQATQTAPAETETSSSEKPKPDPERAHRERTKKAETATQPTDLGGPSVATPVPGPPPQIPATDQPVATAPPVPVAATAPPSPPQPKDVVIPANTTITVQMVDGVDSSVNHAGEVFHASLDTPIEVGDEVVVPKGADVYVRLTSATTAGHIRGKNELRLELVKLEFQGQSYPLVSSTYSVSGESRGKDTAKKVGAGAVLGTIIGAIAAGGKGAAIGGAAGAGAGGVIQGMTKGKKLKVPSETKLDFLLDQPVSVTVMPHSAPSEQ